MQLSIVIVNYDTMALLEQCLASIAQYPPTGSYEIIVVNNGSRRDRSAELASLPGQPVVVNLPHNVGFGRANNFGVEYARGDYVLLLNSDTYYIDDSLDMLMKYAVEHPEYDFLGLSVKNADHSHQESQFIAYPDRPFTHVAYSALRENPLVYRLFRKQLLEAPQTDKYFLSGCHILAKRSAYLETGGFDPDFYIYFEEAEWFYNRILVAPYGVGVCPDATVVHIGGASQDPREASVHYLRSRFLLYYKLHPFFFFFAAAANFVNLAMLAVCIPFFPQHHDSNVRAMRNGWKAWKETVWDIPRYSHRFGSRPAPLTGPEVEWLDFEPAEIEVIDKRGLSTPGPTSSSF